MKLSTRIYTSVGNAYLTFVDKMLPLGGNIAYSIKFASQGLSAFVHIQWFCHFTKSRKDCNV
jgi:hypothetical protein